MMGAPSLGPTLQQWGKGWALWVLFLLLSRAGWETSVTSPLGDLVPYL